MKSKKIKSHGIRHWPLDERPREKLLLYGADKLSDSELLAIIIKTGKENKSAIDLGRELINKFGNFRNIDSRGITELKLSGIGNAKVAQIKAAIEIGKRLNREKSLINSKFETSEEVASYYIPYLRDMKKEVFKIILLNGRNKIIKEVNITEGILTKGIIHPREIIKEAILESAAAIILLHNHPSGEVEPSSEDLDITNHIIKASHMMGINVLDHIIIGDNKYYSFFENNLLKET